MDKNYDELYGKLAEKQIDRREIYDGVILHVVRDSVTLPNGNTSGREMVLHNGAVAIVALTDKNELIMERQFRYAHGRVFYEIPAGKLDTPDEDPHSAAKRELKEETGATARKWTFLGELDTSPALISEKIYMYMAEGLEFGERELDDDEFLEVEREGLSSLYKKVMAGEIADAKTQIAIMKAAALRPEYLKQ